jgi:hypothetical protein
MKEKNTDEFSRTLVYCTKHQILKLKDEEKTVSKGNFWLKQ